MILYAESSAVLAWLFGEAEGEQVRELLADARSVVASELTFVECQRTLIRTVVAGRLTESVSNQLGTRLRDAGRGWVRLAVTAPVLERAAQSFPAEPVRSLDALHLASALVARSSVPAVKLLTLDERVRSNGIGLGFEVVPG